MANIPEWDLTDGPGGDVTDTTKQIAYEVVAAAAADGVTILVVYGMNENSKPEHSTGRALDFMTGDRDGENHDRRRGDWVADYLWAHRVRLRVKWIIWQGRIRSTSPGKPTTWVDRDGDDDPDGDHTDHVHVFTDPGEYVPPAAGGISPPTTTPKPGKDEPPMTWDGKSFPGRDAFKLGKSHPAVTLLGQRLVAHGYGRFYKVGPGPKLGQADIDATAAYQRDQGWTGSDADGYAGPGTWKGLMSTPAKRVDLGKLQTAARTDPGRKQGGTTKGAADDVRIVEAALRAEGLLARKYAGDGSFGSTTVAAYKRWQARAGSAKQYQDGIPGAKDLAELGKKHGFSVTGSGSSSTTRPSSSAGGRIASPCPGYARSTPWRKRPNNNTYWRARGYHTGVDYAAPHGANAVAVRAGTVHRLWDATLGNVALLYADNGTTYWYCHLSSYSGPDGRRVQAGDKIGEVGSSGTGASGGPHLHLERRKGHTRSWAGIDIDPEVW